MEIEENNEEEGYNTPKQKNFEFLSKLTKWTIVV